MGLYDTILLEEGVELPEFPSDKDPRKLSWQSKDIGSPSMKTYKITSDGRLLRKEVTYREATSEELDKKAQERGYDTWGDWEEADTPLNAPLDSWKRVVDDEWWADHNQHGTFEFHASGKRVDGFADYYWSYEARFTRGQLDEIVFLGERLSDNTEPPQES